MAAYVIIDIDVKDQLAYEEYKKRGAPTIIAHGGKPLARGGKTEVLEGSWQPKRMIVLEFKDAQAAKEWWNSEDYHQAKKFRLGAASANVVLLEGL
jgi:uncharacterized protein (DUF1330 family)